MTRIHILRGLWRFKHYFMKIYLLFFLLLSTTYGFTQSKNKTESIYTICQGDFDKDQCLYAKLQNKIVEYYDSKTIALIAKEKERDTIVINFSLAVSNDGTVDLINSFISSSDKEIDIVNKEILQNLGTFIVQKDNAGNSLSEFISTKTYFSIDRSSKPNKLISLPYNGDYTAENISFSVVDEVPIYPGCKNQPKDQLIRCFNKKVLDHVIQNFRYPKKAQRKSISGRVNVMFLIDKEGSITNIRTFGADKILMSEARRIISRLPRMTPGKQKGKLVRVPFALPITFRLQ